MQTVFNKDQTNLAKEEMALLGAFGNKFQWKGKSCGSAMVLFKRAVVISYRLSTVRYLTIRPQFTGGVTLGISLQIGRF